MRRTQKQPASPGETSSAPTSPVELLSSEHAAIHQHFLFRLHRLGRQMVRAIAAKPQPSGLSFSERGTLMTIGNYSPLTLREVAEHAEVDKGQASRLVSSLVAHGLVRKTAHERDGRGIQLALTPKGRELHATLRKDARDLNEQVLVALTAAERVTLERLLAKLESRAEQLAAAAGGSPADPQDR
jgi:DNA-binding MarR family transcriptional regulator